MRNLHAEGNNLTAKFAKTRRKERKEEPPVVNTG